MQNDKLRQLLNLCFSIAMPLMAVLASLGVFGPGIGEVSNRHPTYVVPAGYAFLIWNVIYALMVGYGIWQALPARRTSPLLRRIGWYSASAALATSLWVPVFQRSMFAFSVLIIVWTLLSLIGVFTRMYRQGTAQSGAEHWLVYLNFSIFLGWITVATIANIAQTLTALGWNGGGITAEMWGAVLLIAAGLIATVLTIATRGNVPYALTIIWALVAVAVNQFTGAVPTSSRMVGAVAIGAALVVGITLLITRSRYGAWRMAGAHCATENVTRLN